MNLFGPPTWAERHGIKLALLAALIVVGFAVYMEVQRLKVARDVGQAVVTLAAEVSDEEEAVGAAGSGTWVHGRIEGNVAKAGYTVRLQRKLPSGAWQDIRAAWSTTNASAQWGIRLLETGKMRVVCEPPEGAWVRVNHVTVSPSVGVVQIDLDIPAVEIAVYLDDKTFGDIVFGWAEKPPAPTATPWPTVRVPTTLFPPTVDPTTTPTPTASPYATTVETRTPIATRTPVTGFQQFSPVFRRLVVEEAAERIHLGPASDRRFDVGSPTVQHGMIEMGLGAPLTPVFTVATDGGKVICRAFAQGILVMDPEQTDTAVPYGVITWDTAQLGGTGVGIWSNSTGRTISVTFPLSALASDEATAAQLGGTEQ